MKKETLRKRFLKVVKEERAKGKRYEEIALEIGISIDTMRKFMYNPRRKLSDLTIQKIKNWMQKIKREEVDHGEGTS